jgi:hypothetical protein
MKLNFFHSNKLLNYGKGDLENPINIKKNKNKKFKKMELSILFCFDSFHSQSGETLVTPIIKNKVKYVFDYYKMFKKLD